MATNPCDGIVAWSSIKSLGVTSHAHVVLVGGYFTFRLDAVAFSCELTGVTLCLGHSIGLHRLLIHRDFKCFRLLEYLLVNLGTVVGMGGPFRMLYLHDIRDWAQRHNECHPLFIDSDPMCRDLYWQLDCEV
jgi:fatty-acid desaturase